MMVVGLKFDLAPDIIAMGFPHKVWQNIFYAVLIYHITVPSTCSLVKVFRIIPAFRILRLAIESQPQNAKFCIYILMGESFQDYSWIQDFKADVL